MGTRSTTKVDGRIGDELNDGRSDGQKASTVEEARADWEVAMNRSSNAEDKATRAMVATEQNAAEQIAAGWIGKPATAKLLGRDRRGLGSRRRESATSSE
ncbi:hypothetical protein M0R45_023326 [Rubus argutus]|uniref:Uncharacterized protein n=1 Tax=Rubus argutus TaxID=59490 RepID=A0AAW1WPG4_RUBAR